MASIARTIGLAAATFALLCPAWAAEVNEVPALAPAASLGGLSMSYSVTLPQMTGLPSLPAAVAASLQPQVPAAAAADAVSPEARVSRVADTAAAIAAPIMQAASGGASVSDETLSRSGADLADMKLNGGGDAVQAPADAPLAERIAVAQPLVREFYSEVGKRIVGQKEAVDLALVSLLVDKGHLLFVGEPGLAKSYLGETVGIVSGLPFNRIQFTNDMQASDLAGYEDETMKVAEGEVPVKKGPIFKGTLNLFDEINRASPKAKSGVLQAMAEGQVSIGPYLLQLESLYKVWGTMNPFKTKGVYPMDEAEIDRYLISIMMKRPSREEEMRIADEQSRGLKPPLKQVFNPAKLRELSDMIKTIPIRDDLKAYSVDVARATDPHLEGNPFDLKGFVERGANVRASIAMQKVARVFAFLNNRDYVNVDDIQHAAVYVLRHRIELSHLARSQKMEPEAVIEEILHGPRAIPVPKSR